MPYLLDSNVLIDAKNRYYAFDICPGFWNCLISYHKDGQLLSIDRVKRELEKGNDELKAWVKIEMPESCFASTNIPEVIKAFANLMNWVQLQPQFKPEAKAEFASVADGWLIAYAMVYKLTLVTDEVLNPEIKKRVTIPNVCKAFGVNYLNTFEMLRCLGVRYHWTKTK